MMFMSDDAFLNSKKAKELYGKVKDLPIYDFHSHLSVQDILEDRKYDNIGQLWLEGDHYKWRLMRANGVPEEYVTGGTSWHDKFIAFAGVIPFMPGNPIYHWCHMELKKYFNIDTPLTPASAEDIWKLTSDFAATGAITARRLIAQSNVEVICTTDDPADDLAGHAAISQDPSFQTKVSPAFRPDIACTGIARSDFVEYTQKVAQQAGVEVKNFADWLNVLRTRVDYFYKMGCRISDLSATFIPESVFSEANATNAFDRAMRGEALDPTLEMDYIYYMMVFFARQYAEKGIVMQLHLSALRSVNSSLLSRVGENCGNDSVGPIVSIKALGSLFNEIDQQGGLPKTVVYTLNPTNYYEIATMIGNFQGDGIKGKFQLGAAWWYCDHLDGIREQMRVTAATGLLGRFVGMLTDSRSFSSYARHDYFRRILCSLIGEWVELGEFCDDEQILENLVKGISVQNARNYFGI